MKRLPMFVAVLAAAGLLLPCFVGVVQSAERGSGAPPVGQTLVREGDFAVSLSETLRIGKTDDEAQAENDLAEMGISPRNGWIGDYPMTPDIVAELYDAVAEAADAGKLSISKDEALRNFENLTAELGLPLRSNQSGEYGQSQVEGDAGQYAEPELEAVNEYYSSEGPPVVTYYTPPWDYYYMYGWVPYPFWWDSYYFPGFFVLHDFHSFRRVHVVRRNINRVAVKRVTNHVVDRNTNRIARVDPVNRHRGRNVSTLTNTTRERGFRSAEDRKRAESIVRRNSERIRSAGATRGGGRDVVTNRPTSSVRDRILGDKSNPRGRGGGELRNAQPNGRVQNFRTPGRQAENFQAPRGRAGNHQAPGRQVEMNRAPSNPSGQFERRGTGNFDRGSGGGGDRSFGMPGNRGGGAGGGGGVRQRAWHRAGGARAGAAAFLPCAGQRRRRQRAGAFHRAAHRRTARGHGRTRRERGRWIGCARALSGRKAGYEPY